MKRFLLPFCLLFFGLRLAAQDATATDHVLWYDEPAGYFEESLVLGNGRVGATVFGGVETDTIFLNDLTLWSGEPVDTSIDRDAHEVLPAIREALARDDYEAADSLNVNLQGPYSESYAPLGTMHLHFDGQAKPTKYYRELDIANAVARVRYRAGGTTFEREYFVSHPDQVVVIRLTADRPGALNTTLDFKSLLRYDFARGNRQLDVHGYAPYSAEPSYHDVPDPVRFDPERGTRFSSLFRVSKTDGQVSVSDSTLSIRNASEAVLLVSIATSFNGFDKDPARQGRNNRTLAAQALEVAASYSCDALKERHIADYRGFYDRVQLDLGSTDAPLLPTDARLQRYATGAEDTQLEELYFNFGRYLLISSSRTPEVPANLQGLWNPYLRPPWSSNYTTNINVEENYWLAGPANLSELHEPLLGWIRNLAVTGEASARNYYNSGGWSVAHNSDIWAMSNPVGEKDGGVNWANWNMGGAWLATHLWEHYLFTLDTAFLHEEAYPLLKGATQFCMDWVVRDYQGHWITSPSTSPEAKYVTKSGYVGSTLYGGTADLAMMKELFDDFIGASLTLGIQDSFLQEVYNVKAELHPYRLGRKGNIREWFYDWNDEDPRHRHQTHLFGVHPGHHIAPDLTPQLARAARVSLDLKGNESTGWSKGWRINLWARLWDGDRAYRLYRSLLKYVPAKGAVHGGTYPNLLDAHPPFQIDGNFGGAAGIIEMLVQSTEDHIRFTPALPKAWSRGSLTGVRTRGGCEVTLEWSENRLQRTTIKALKDTRTTVIHGQRELPLRLKAGESRVMNW
ncbi:glycosyl hydrolase family 95 catalytic domain-containing protein [Lewinella sp. IMCC34191]|uniref:glycoside hydrolase family 95 protein n=1 Tax=Lewinella sp. IMCC34191 TaxID=2259172 RepID=UPI000E26F6B2|nr:glycoside hydrolase family 95 protein [Lewinella sp. IMCC34191]